jgi:predicted NUDIX family NTP pyrophosphohydrolase
MVAALQGKEIKIRSVAQISAGLLMFKKVGENLEFFLVHPGGPYFKNKDSGWWTIPKGLPEENESLLVTAIREFKEETGIIPTKPYFNLGSIKQKGNKIVYAWAFEGKWDPVKGIICNNFKLEWPPNSKIYKSFPEIDQAEWMSFESASQKINQQQLPFLLKLKEMFY